MPFSFEIIRVRGHAYTVISRGGWYHTEFVNSDGEKRRLLRMKTKREARTQIEAHAANREEKF